MALLLLILVACVAAFAWHALAVDPGYVAVRLGATTIETSLVVAVAALLLAWGASSLAWRLLRWPFRAWSRRSRRRGRERIAAGLVALAEGRYRQAMRDLERASHASGMRAPALLAAARAAHARGEDAAVDAALDAASEHAPAAALTLRARFLIERGEPADALALLREAAKTANLSPGAQRLHVEAALACGDAYAALDALPALARTQSLPEHAYAVLEARVLAAALASAPDAARLNALWSGFARAQRRDVDVVIAYARRAAALGQTLPAMSEIETALRRGWSEPLARAYGELGPAESDTRLRHAEAWIEAQPNSAGLMLALGRLCIQCNLWGKAREYLGRGLAIEPSPALWEALGDCCSAQADGAGAAVCYRNALKSSRGEPAEEFAAGARALDTRASVVEERSEHGVPRLALPRS